MWTTVDVAGDRGEGDVEVGGGAAARPQILPVWFRVLHSAAAQVLSFRPGETVVVHSVHSSYDYDEMNYRMT